MKFKRDNTIDLYDPLIREENVLLEPHINHPVIKPSRFHIL